MDWPAEPPVLTSLAAGKAPGRVARVELLGHGRPLAFSQDPGGLRVTVPPAKVGTHAHTLKISGLTLG